MRKLLLLLICFILSMGLLTGCSNSSQQSDDSQKENDFQNSGENEYSTTDTSMEDNSTEIVEHTPVPAVFENENNNNEATFFQLTFDSSLVKLYNVPPKDSISTYQYVVCWVDDTNAPADSGCSVDLIKKDALSICEFYLSDPWTKPTLLEDVDITINGLSGHKIVYEYSISDEIYCSCIIALNLGDGYSIEIVGPYDYMTSNNHTPEELISATYISHTILSNEN